MVWKNPESVSFISGNTFNAGPLKQGSTVDVKRRSYFSIDIHQHHQTSRGFKTEKKIET